METPENQAAQAQDPELLPLNDLNQAMALLHRWHRNSIAQLNQAISVPDDVEVEVTDHATGEVFNLNQEQRVGFRAGLSIAFSIFRDLPFVIEFEDAGNDKDLPEAVGQEEGHDLSN